MATIYSICLFGLLAVTLLPSNFAQHSKEEKAKAKLLQKKSKELKDKGNKRIMEKVKEIRKKSDLQRQSSQAVEVVKLY